MQIWGSRCNFPHQIPSNPSGQQLLANARPIVVLRLSKGSPSFANRVLAGTRQLGNLAWQQAASVRNGEGWDDEWGAFCVQACPWAGRVWGRLALTAHTALIGSQVCYHHGNNADPEERDCPSAFSDIQDVQILSCFVRDHLPDLQPEPAIKEHCMYTVRVQAAGPGLSQPWRTREGDKRTLSCSGQTLFDP